MCKYQSIYYGIVSYDKFIGVKAGRSCWKRVNVRLRSFYTYGQALNELRYFVDSALHAFGVKLVSYCIESELTDIMGSACNGCNAPKQCCPCK